MGLDVLRNNFQLVVLVILWLLAGAYTGPVVYLFIPLTLVLLFLNNKFPELFFGFLIILVISDSLEDPMVFAKSFKNIYILILFFFLIVSIKKFKKVISIYKYFIPYLIFAAIGLMYSPVINVSIQKLLSYLLLLILVPNYISYCYELRGKFFFRDLIYFLLAIIVVGFLVRFVWVDVAYSHGGRLRGIFGNPNGLGIFMVVFFLLYNTVKIKYPSLFNRYENAFILLVIFYVTFKTGSRAALLAVILFYFFNRLFLVSVYLGFILFFIILVGMEFLIFYFPQIVTALGMERTFRLETLEEGSGRWVAWEFAWQNIKDSFLIGRGLAFDEHLMRSNFEMLSKEGHEGGVHNTYLIMWLNTGLLGLLAFFRGFFLLFIKAGTRYRQAFPMMFSIMLSINFEPWLSASLNPYTIIFLIIITLLTEDYFIDEINDTENEEEMEIVADLA